ncbi:MAG: UvrB/UvrC motif-containing protein [Phycisphaerae bacterium]
MEFVCQHCNQAKATVHITDTFPERRERHLCDECAEKESVIIKQHHKTTTDILKEFIKQKATPGGADDHTCPNCGISFREFRLKGQLGCPRDYDVFRALLAPLIERAHEGATHHVGKVPITADTVVRRQAGLIRLRRELQEAVDHEDYEQAARLRDEIKKTFESPEAK